MGLRIFAVDAETDGLYGDPFAVGAVVLDEDGVEVDSFSGVANADLVEDAWVRANVLPFIGELPVFPSRLDLREEFWRFWLRHRADSLCVADVGVPVEALLFRLCVVTDSSRAFLGPYPLHDLATLVYACGADAVGARPALAAAWGVPWSGDQHNPLDDARLAAQLFRAGLGRLGASRRGDEPRDLGPPSFETV